MALALYFLIILSNITQSAATKAFNQRNYAPAFFNIIKAASALLITLIFSLPTFKLHLPTVIFGLAYGAMLSSSMYAGYEALCRGPMALTSMLVSFSVVIPFTWGVTVRNEEMTPLKAVAIVLLICAIICTNADKIAHRGEKKKGFGAWLAFVALTFVCNGAFSVLQKEHQTLYPSQYKQEFTVFALLLCTVIYSVPFLLRKEKRAFGEIKGKSFALLAGVTTVLSSLLTLMLASFENASILFSIISAGGVLASLLCGRFVFREKLRSNHYLALVLGIVSIVLMKL